MNIDFVFLAASVVNLHLVLEAAFVVFLFVYVGVVVVGGGVVGVVGVVVVVAAAVVAVVLLLLPCDYGPIVGIVGIVRIHDDACLSCLLSLLMMLCSCLSSNVFLISLKHQKKSSSWSRQGQDRANERNLGKGEGLSVKGNCVE